VNVAPIGDDVLIARLVQLTPAEAINDDGSHARVILATFTGNLNAPDAESVDDVEMTEVRVLVFAETADRIVAGLTRAIDDVGVDRRPDDLDGWIDAVRLSAVARLGDLDPDVVERRAAADDLLDHLAGRMGITLDRPTLRTMAFALAAVQALHIVTSTVPPDDPGFSSTVVDVMGQTIDLIVRRYDDAAGETSGP
jgi:hypothetical protein